MEVKMPTCASSEQPAAQNLFPSLSAALKRMLKRLHDKLISMDARRIAVGDFLAECHS